LPGEVWEAPVRYLPVRRAARSNPAAGPNAYAIRARRTRCVYRLRILVSQLPQ
jgi:hypothetical protein